MDKGFTDNGFIIDLTHAQKVSEIIYELSKALDMPDAKNKHICLKLGAVDLNETELSSIKTLIELMESTLAYISTSSAATLETATKLGIKISEFTNEISAPSFDDKDKDSSEVVKALDNIFGEDKPAENESVKVVKHEDEIEEPEIKEDEEEDVKKLRKEPENLPTLYIRRTIRSGQSISSDGNLVIIGDVNSGAEIIAKGDITVWGILAGIAHAGSDGNNYARIRALKLNPVQIRIGDIFARRPDSVNIPFVQKTSEYTPEEAFTHNGSIIIKKIHNEN
ncbi:MAG: septum site-determining protein MinC [Cyanobacteriota bacterium]|nr:septum site-determining protein MinC [Cyanobacteriota bacterium]MDY6358806.1 septum site-determining protein MinC [Cyanobacteriota bacterium]MDY6383187.1 septum site-determining protein MinC [Cyanobacteriota bacterium]